MLFCILNITLATSIKSTHSIHLEISIHRRCFDASTFPLDHGSTTLTRTFLILSTIRTPTATDSPLLAMASPDATYCNSRRDSRDTKSQPLAKLKMNDEWCGRHQGPAPPQPSSSTST
ncbi:hypothetical protein C8Q73DRAFT_216931 [Cubamyces lactineus]|nr:hypothetical protein C8Q73DRAFT_216931 [Cubamyces lactineus]